MHDATEAVIARGLPKVAPKTITDPELLRQELARVRGRSATPMTISNSHADMRCLAIPVFEKGGEVPGGIAISGPSSRFDLKHLEELRRIAVPHAERLSRLLGGIT